MFFFTNHNSFYFQIDILRPFEAHRIPGLQPCNVTPEKRRKEHTIEKTQTNKMAEVVCHKEYFTLYQMSYMNKILSWFINVHNFGHV